MKFRIPGAPPKVRRVQRHGWLFLTVWFTMAGLEVCGQSTMLPQNHGFQTTLYQWLETITLTDVTVPVGARVQWDGTAENNQELSRIWSETLADGDNVRGWNASTMSEAKWYVLDDGQGHGIEGFGKAQGDRKVRLPRVGDASGGISGMASEIAWWYQFDLPRANGGQGNPLYQHRGAGNRALVLAAVDLMMLSHCIDTGEPNCNQNWGDRTDFIGGYLIEIAEAVYVAGDLLSETTRDAFFEGMEYLVDRMLELGAKDVNSNMDGKAIEGCALTTLASGRYAPSHGIQGKCQQLAKLILFGFRDGQIDTRPYKIDSDKGIFYLEGLVREADGPETTYNGRSMAHLAAARTFTYGNAGWNFLDGVLTRMCDFMFAQFYQQPGNEASKYQTPSGYSNRTPEGMKSPQDTPWANMSLGYLYEECRPLIWNWKFNEDYVVDPIGKLKPDIERAIAAMETVPQFTDVPGEWIAKEPWPRINPYLPPAKDWHATLRNHISRGDHRHVNSPDRSIHFSRTFPSVEDATDEWQNEVQWWSRRAGRTGEDFAYFIEGTAFSGTFEGYYSGKLEAFWRENQGPVILGMREVKRLLYGWENVHKWRVDHVWGYNSKNESFSWAKANGDKDPASTSARSVSWDAAREIFEVITPMEDRGEAHEGVLTGKLTLTKRFAALANGLEVTTIVESDGGDKISELWMTLPLYEGGTGSNPRPRGFSVEVFTGNGWVNLKDGPRSGDQVRIGHNWGSGFVYSYLLLDDARLMKLQEVDTQLDQQYIHPLQIDLHGNPGTPQSLPNITSLKYALVTSNGILPTGDAEIPQPDAGPVLQQNFPNPFNDETTITLGIAEATPVKLEVFDVTGRKVKALVDQPMLAGTHQITWNAENLADGVYVIKLQTKQGDLYRNAILLR